MYNEFITFLQSLLEKNCSLNVLALPLCNLLIHCRRITLLALSQSLPQNFGMKPPIVPFSIEFGHSLDILIISFFMSGPSSNIYKFVFKANELFDSSHRPSKAAIIFRDLGISGSSLIRSLINLRSVEILTQLFYQLESIKTHPTNFVNIIWTLCLSSDTDKEPSYVSGICTEFGSSSTILFSVILKICPYSGNCIFLPDGSQRSYYLSVKDNFNDFVNEASDLLKACSSLIAAVFKCVFLYFL